MCDRSLIGRMRRQPRRPVARMAILLSAACLGTLALAWSAATWGAHGDDWISRIYPYCCGERDCEPVGREAVTWEPPGEYAVLWKGAAFRVKEAEAKASYDGRSYICEVAGQFKFLIVPK